MAKIKEICECEYCGMEFEASHTYKKEKVTYCVFCGSEITTEERDDDFCEMDDYDESEDEYSDE